VRDTGLTPADSPTGKVAIVTGAASGIGLGIAQRLARDGTKVAIFDLNADGAGEETAKLCSDDAEAVGVEVDVSKPEQVQRGVEDVRARFGPVTILMNNAGVGAFPGRPEDIATACAFPVSDEASYITGQVIGVNGGRNT